MILLANFYSSFFVDQIGVQGPGDKGGGGVQVEKAVKGKLRRVWGDSGGVVLEKAYGEAT